MPRRQILIAEDNPTLAHLLISQLQSEGYETIHAADGAAAWRLLERQEPPDLIIVDVLMPGLGGLALCRRIRATPRLATVPVILATGLDDSSSRLAGLEAGANDFLGKPWSKAELYARVRTLLDVRALRDAYRRPKQQLELLFELGRELGASLNVDETLALTIARAAQVLDATGGSAVLVDARGPRHRIVIDDALAPRVTVPPLLDEFEQRVAAWLFESGRPLRVVDTATIDGWSAPARSLLAAPLVRQERIRGFLLLTHRRPNHFEQEALDLLDAVARQVTMAIENARLAERVQAERRRLAVLSYSLAEAVIVTDREQRILLTNPAGAALLGEPDGDLRGRPLRTLVDDETLPSLFAQVAAGGEPWAAEIEWSDGRYLVATISPVDEEMEDGLVAVIQEIDPLTTTAPEWQGRPVDGVTAADQGDEEE
jgi:two-component system, OmpR family, response regulator MprA